MRTQTARHGKSPDELRQLESLFDPRALTIGFARRFATYKRAVLVLSDLERLGRLLSNPERPVQILFAGKAHPADRAGQDVIRRIFQLTQDQFRGRIVFLEDYDMEVGRMLVQGADVYLTKPFEPQVVLSMIARLLAAASGDLQEAPPAGAGGARAPE